MLFTMLSNATELLQQPLAHATSSRPNRKNHKAEQTAHLKAWFDGHDEEPYPTRYEKEVLSAQTAMDIKQVEGWFTNHRKRNWAKKGEK